MGAGAIDYSTTVTVYAPFPRESGGGPKKSLVDGIVEGLWTVRPIGVHLYLISSAESGKEHELAALFR